MYYNNRYELLVWKAICTKLKTDIQNEYSRVFQSTFNVVILRQFK